MFNFSLFIISDWGIDLDYYECCMVCLGNEPRSFCHFWVCHSVRLSCWLWGLLHFFCGILVHSSRYNGHLNCLPISIHFSSLIPKMSILLLAHIQYLRLLIFLLAILIPACDSSSPEFHMIYSAYKQGDNIQPWCTPFLILNQSVVPCLVLTVASWLAYRFLRRQVGSNDFSDGRLGCEHPEEQEQILLISVFLHTWQG